MRPSTAAWPDALHPDAVCLTVDVEWAHPDVLADLVALFDAAGVSATFFVTHAGVLLPGHERGLHPNFRRNGDSYQALLASCQTVTQPTDDDVHRFVLDRTRTFAPEATGVRTHCLYSESTLHRRFQEFGIAYDCTLRLPFVPALRPVRQLHDIISIPTYYADQLDLYTHTTAFRVTGLKLDQPGLKVLVFHPNMVFLNASTESHYQSMREAYHDPGALLRNRNSGRGVRTLLLELLDEIAAGRIHTTTTGAVNRAWRTLPDTLG